MPIYDYRCAECGKDFEILAAIAEAPPQLGPGCEAGSCRLARQYGPVAGHVARAGAIDRDEAVAAAADFRSMSPRTPHVCAKYCSHHKK